MTTWKSPLEQLDHEIAELVRMQPLNDPGRGTPVDTSNRTEFTICEAALLCSGREIPEGGFFAGDLNALLAHGGPNDAYSYSQDLRDALIDAVAAGEFEIIPRRTKDGAIDPLKTKIPVEQLIPWLTARGVRPDSIFPGGEPQVGAQAPADGGGSELATRDQLIKAFGSFTGMDKQWFKNLKDTPALLKARKLAGQGGRGHIMEPYFCPFEVMQWLASPKRKRGRNVSEHKCWELLEKYFPRVYAQHGAADPRE